MLLSINVNAFILPEPKKYNNCCRDVRYAALEKLHDDVQAGGEQQEEKVPAPKMGYTPWSPDDHDEKLQVDS